MRRPSVRPSCRRYHDNSKNVHRSSTKFMSEVYPRMFQVSIEKQLVLVFFFSHFINVFKYLFEGGVSGALENGVTMRTRKVFTAALPSLCQR